MRMLCCGSALLPGTPALALFQQQLAQRSQFAAARSIGLRIAQLQRLNDVEQNTRHDEARVWLVIGLHDVPRRMAGARGAWFPL
jgi:hypothetical protein